jgi:mono/diheme cytochrome c family protein
MRRFGVLSAAAVCAALLASPGLQAQAPAKKADAPSSKKVERGKYLVSILACGDCHSPKKMGPNGPEEDPARLLMGHPEGAKVQPLPKLADTPWIAATNGDMTAWAGPWGVSYAINLTPDENTGIGSWSEATFIGAIRTGKHMGASRPILPPMPWPAYRNLNDEDLASIYAYLRTIKPVHNRIPDPEPPAGAPASAAASAKPAK